MSPLLLVEFGTVFDYLCNVFVNSWVLLFEVGGVAPFGHLAEHEAFAVLDRVFSVETADHLHWPGGCCVDEVKECKAAWKGLGWLNIVSVIYIWVDLSEIVDICYVLVVGLDVGEALEAINCIVLVIPGRFCIVIADYHIQNDVLVIVHQFLASLDCRSQVGVPHSATVHTYDAIWPHLVREDHGQGCRGHDRFNGIVCRLVENHIVSCDNVHTGDGYTSIDLILKLFED